MPTTESENIIECGTSLLCYQIQFSIAISQHGIIFRNNIDYMFRPNELAIIRTI